MFMRFMVSFLLILLSGSAFAGELYDSFFEMRMSKEFLKKTTALKPTTPEEIIEISLLRLPDTVVNGGPEYRIDLDSKGIVKYHGVGEVDSIGKLQGRTLKDDFSRIGKYIFESDFFDLGSLSPSYSDAPKSVLCVKTKEGEKWVIDPHELEDLHPTVKAIGEMMDKVLANSSMRISVPKLHGTNNWLIYNSYRPPAKIVCFGDSVTGVYYHTGGRRAYTDMVEIGLEKAYPKTPAANLTAINAGISGNTTVDALKRIQKDVLDHKPDLVTIMFGLNDMTRVSLEDYRANLKSIISQCRLNGSEVMLCTPNSVRDTSGRPTAKLEKYVAVVRELAATLNVPLADCYATFETVRNKDPLEWAFLMSDEIHPNMDGHKRIAETTVGRITSKSDSLVDVPAPQPAIPHTLALIGAKKPIKVLAMPPYDALLTKLLGEVAPDSPLDMTSWIVEGKTLAEIEEAAKGVRDKKYDLVFIAVPAEASAPTPEAFIQSYSWILNRSLSFNYQEWDVVAVPPSLSTIPNGDSKTRSEWGKRMIRAQDFTLIDAEDGSMDTATRVLRQWLEGQLPALALAQ